jgi:lipopolysaccharide transport system ATP-binding protein
VLGIIGRNGAGKSTLLKILSRITEPTQGRVSIRGRVASLLEVGTGFHAELSGRENIFLNGAILGMTRAEIKRKFDEIVAFAEVEKFLDTPVKRYSSGMYVRLAFAVAAHLEPEILVVDEVLAVGDAEFQKKCLGKMSEVAGHGRTVLFVSHNLAAVNELTTRALLLCDGRVQFSGDVAVAIATYLAPTACRPVYETGRNQDRNAPHVGRAEVVTSQANGMHRFGEQLEVKFVIKHSKLLKRPHFSFQIVNQFQQPVLHAWALHPQVRFGTVGSESILECRFPDLRLNVGRYHLRTHLTEAPGGEVYERLDDICAFEVVRTDAGMPWGWHPQFCTYHAPWHWIINGDQQFASESKMAIVSA